MRNKKQQTRIKRKDIYKGNTVDPGTALAKFGSSSIYRVVGKKFKENKEPQRDRRKKEEEEGRK